MNKKILSIMLAAAMAASVMTGCTSTATESSEDTTAASAASQASSPAASAADTSAAEVSSSPYDKIVLGETGTDITTEIKLLTNRTDMLDDTYAGTSWAEYLAEFNKIYPNITVDIEGITDYSTDSLLRLQAGGWGDIMMIPAVDLSELSNYFISYGSLDDLQDEIRFASDKAYDGQVYGIAITGNAQGIVYNKAVFEKAGITTLPTTPDEFLADLQLIKDNTDAIPLYTNYAAGWTMGAWDAYITGTATGDATYEKQILPHESNPFEDKGDGAHAYNVYRVLYDAVADGLTEDDYTTTDWEGSKGMINNGEIGCMVLGSWAYSQMQAAGDHPDDIGYMPFPMTVDGTMYASAGPDYSFGIASDTTEDNQLASMIFVKWMTEQSGFSYNEGGMPIDLNSTNWPDLYAAFDNVTYVASEPALAGEESLLGDINAESELAINNGGNEKVQSIVEHAASGDESFDDIMGEWNAAWTSAQETCGATILN